jgi:Protein CHLORORESPIRATORY REDUCTION 7
MVDSRLYSTETFVFLDSHQPEQFLTAEELCAKLQDILSTQQDTLPRDLERFDNLEAQAQYLMETACEFKPSSGGFLQWYAVRLEKEPIL